MDSLSGTTKVASMIHTIRIKPDYFWPCYRLLEESFARSELDSASRMLSDLAAFGSPQRADQSVMFARMDSAPSDTVGSSGVVSLISGCYLSLAETDFSGQGIGFIEYLVTREDCRQQGHASALLITFEQEMAEIAANMGEELKLLMGEVEPDMLGFKRKRGYYWPLGSRYSQPPLDFDPITGIPCIDAVSKTLMVKAWNRPIEAKLLLQSVELVFRLRYAPTQFDAQPAQVALAYIMQHIFEPFAASLCVEQGQTILI